jgi:orotate phosphoribosyltransferase
MITQSIFDEHFIIVREYINDYCLLKGPTSDFSYSWSFTLNKATYNADILTRIIEMFMFKIQDTSIQVTGMETGATPLIVGFGLLAGVHGFVTCKEENLKYGVSTRFKGTPTNLPVVVVDDMSNTGMAILKCRERLIENKLNVHNYALSIVARKRTLGGLNIVSLYTLEDFGIMPPR